METLAEVPSIGDQVVCLCVMWQIAKLRRDLVHAVVWVGLGLCVAAIVGIEMWSRCVSASSSN